MGRLLFFCRYIGNTDIGVGDYPNRVQTVVGFEGEEAALMKNGNRLERLYIAFLKVLKDKGVHHTHSVHSQGIVSIRYL